MKIDEAIERVKYTNLHCDMYEVCRFNGECGECAEALDIVVNSLEWYRNQDLIPRQSAVETARTLDMSSIGLKLSIMNKLMAIPKAEYRGESNDNNKKID